MRKHAYSSLTSWTARMQGDNKKWQVVQKARDTSSTEAPAFQSRAHLEKENQPPWRPSSRLTVIAGLVVCSDQEAGPGLGSQPLPPDQGRLVLCQPCRWF